MAVNESNWRDKVNQLIEEWAREITPVAEPQSVYRTNPRYENNPLLDKTFIFGVAILDFVEVLVEKRKYEIASQLIKSGTSIGTNSREAQNAESKADFVHKIKVALKEADETEYWLLLCNASTHYPSTEDLLDNLHPILKILNKILSTCKNSKK